MPTYRETRAEKSAWAAVRRAEVEYARRLRAIARNIAAIINGFPATDPMSDALINQSLGQYAQLIRPWARATGERMLQDVERRDAKAWARLAQQMARALRLEIEQAPTGLALQDALARQVDLITSLPLQAAERVHELTLEGIMHGIRAREIAALIRDIGNITLNRATLIARTEVARTSSTLTQVRAEYVGSEGYIWLTVRDARVRPDHRVLEGRFIRWNEPPIVDKRTQRRAHAGQDIQCRCTPLPVVPDILPDRQAA